ncbi:MAG: ABC transporter ATP-binding protein, partial [Bacteroidota bacterium]
MSDKETASEKILEWKAIRKLAEFAKPYKAKFWFLVLLTISVGLLGPIRPFLVEYTINHYILFNNYSGLVNMTILMVVLLVIQAYVQYMHTYLSGWLGQ